MFEIRISGPGKNALAMTRAHTPTRAVTEGEPSARARGLLLRGEDPAQDVPYAKAKGHGHLETAPGALGLAIDVVEKIHKLRLPWWHVWRAAEKAGKATPKHPVIFECVGVRGLIQKLVTRAVPRRSSALLPRRSVFTPPVSFLTMLSFQSCIRLASRRMPSERMPIEAPFFAFS